jgi:hypothetical protein
MDGSNLPNVFEQIKNKIARLPAKVALIRWALMPLKALAPRYFLKRFQCTDAGAGERWTRNVRKRTTHEAYGEVISSRHCESSKAINFSACRAMDCFAPLAMRGVIL